MPLSRYGFRTKRARSFYGRGPGAKRRRTGGRTGLTGRSKFINQLGGWSANKVYSKNSKEIEITGKLNQHNVTMQVDGKGVSVIHYNPTIDHFDASEIFPKFQQWKLKRLEIFFDVVHTNRSGTGVSVVQLSIAKLRNDDAPSNISAIPGCQSKIIYVTDDNSSPTKIDEFDLIRAACYWPPLNVETESVGGGNPTSALATPWLDGKNYAGYKYNGFAVQISASGGVSTPLQFTCNYYYKATWIAKTPMFSTS